MKNIFRILIALALVVCTISLAACKDNKDPGDENPEIPEGGFESGDESEGPIVDIPGFEG